MALSDIDKSPLYIDSTNGRVGIGTSSPSDNLDVASAAPTLRLTDTDGYYSQIYGGSGSLVFRTDVGQATGGDTMQFVLSGSEAMRIDNSGNVGIGTTSPSRTLTINSGIINTAMRLESTDQGVAIEMYDGTTTSTIAGGTAGIEFYPSGSIAAKIDTSGNLLVGTTVADIVGNGGDGLTYRPNAGISVSRNTSGGTVIQTNRTANDGTHILFFRSASAGSPVTVGQITNHSVDLHIENASGGGSDAGIALQNNDRINPVRNGALSDGTIDIGYSNYRWRNLYLSGGVIFGTTGGNVTDKTLDDYEEGTWTGSVSVNGFTQTISSITGYYTKIGRIVYISYTVSLSSAGYASGYSLFSGLPFTAYNNQVGGYYGNGSISANGIGNTNFINGASAAFYLYPSTATTNTSVWQGTFTYMT